MGALALASCARQGPPAPVLNNNALATVAATPVADITQGGGKVVVRKGQTLYAVARAAGVPLRSLIDANHLQPPYHLHTGETLIVPPIHGHLVQHGETLYRVSRQYGVEAATLVQLNHLVPPYRLKVGQMLTLPPSVVAAGEPERTEATPWRQPLSTPSQSAAKPSSESTAPLAPLPTVELGASAVPPVIAEPTTQAPPAPVGAPRAPVAAPPSGTSAPPLAALASASPPAPAPLSPSSTPVAEMPTPQPAPVPPEQSLPNASEARVAALVAAHDPPSAPLFYWPVRGRVIAVFGPAPGGTHNDGINISAPLGTIVSAAENGTVAYAGDALKGFGNLLLIKHPGGWVSAYAHNDVLLVRRGDRVRRGQPVARLGNTGGVSAPQLHFELRQGVKPIDPLDHLPQLVGGNG